VFRNGINAMLEVDNISLFTGDDEGVIKVS